MSRIENALEKANRIRKTNEQADSGVEPSVRPIPRSRYKYILLIICISFAAVIIVIIGIYSSGTNPSEFRSQEFPQKANSAVIPPAAQNLKLPSSVQQKTFDAAYANSHPGWEKYDDDHMEFRIYRENQTIKAIQVIARQGKMITHEYFRSFLKEIAGSDLYTITSNQTQDDYLIEKGQAANNFAMISYKNNDNGGLKAFVLSTQ